VSGGLGLFAEDFRLGLLTGNIGCSDDKSDVVTCVPEMPMSVPKFQVYPFIGSHHDGISPYIDGVVKPRFPIASKGPILDSFFVQEVIII